MNDDVTNILSPSCFVDIVKLLTNQKTGDTTKWLKSFTIYKTLKSISLKSMITEPNMITSEFTSELLAAQTKHRRMLGR